MATVESPAIVRPLALDRPRKSPARSPARFGPTGLPLPEEIPPVPQSPTSEAGNLGFEGILANTNSAIRRLTQISDIPMYEKRERQGSKSDSIINGTVRVHVIPTAESLGFMMEEGRDGDSTYSSFQTYSKGAENVNGVVMQTLPLQIRRKKLQSADSVNGEARQGDNAIALRIKHTLDQAIAQRTPTPPPTPPTLSYSVYSDSNTDADSLRSSNKSSWQSWHPLGIARTLNSEEPPQTFTNMLPKVITEKQQETETVELEAVTASAKTDVDLASVVPDACPMIAEPDLPGVLPKSRDRSGSQPSSASEIEEDDDEDDESLHRFSLEAFPVPSIVLASPSAITTPVLFPKQPHGAAAATSPKSALSSRSTRSTPRPDLFRAPSVQTTSSNWDLAEEVMILEHPYLSNYIADHVLAENTARDPR